MSENSKKFDKIAYNNAFNAEKYDSLRITVPKGKKAIIKAHAEKHDGGKINAFVCRAIEEAIERDNREK